MAYTKVHKVQFDTHMLEEEAEYQWGNAYQRMEILGIEIIWVVFKAEFLDKYFLKDVCGKKEIYFLKLKQGNMIVVEYAALFEELVKICPHYNSVAAEGSKCIKYENDLHREIKQCIRYQEIHQFHVPVNKCKKIYEDNKAWYAMLSTRVLVLRKGKDNFEESRI